MTAYRTAIFGDKIIFSGDFSQASSPIYLDDECTQWQVADFRHNPHLAAKCFIEELIRDGGDDPDDFRDEIEKACSNCSAFIERIEYRWNGEKFIFAAYSDGEKLDVDIAATIDADDYDDGQTWRLEMDIGFEFPGTEIIYID